MVVRAPGNTVEFKSFNSRLYAADQPLRRSRTLDGDTGEAIDLNSTVGLGIGETLVATQDRNTDTRIMVYHGT